MDGIQHTYGTNIAVDIGDLKDRSTSSFINDHGLKRPLFESLLREAMLITGEKQTRRIWTLGGINFLATLLLLYWCSSTNSMALTAFTYLTIFDIFSLITCLVSIWVKMKQPTRTYSFGYERFEVLAVFSSTLLAQLGALFVVKESIERMVIQPDIHLGRLLVGTGLGFTVHMLVTYFSSSRAFLRVIQASSSSWLQEHVTDISESLCSFVPGMSKLLLPRINPFALIGSASAGALVLTYFVIDIWNYHSADTWVAVWIALMISGTMFPMSVYTGKILLQTTPSHMITQLDKCLREASTLDGVLEFRSEHFWTLSFTQMAGSVHVRVRRDADEQMVLAHVYHRLSNLVPILTVQIFKDDWNRPSSFQILGETSLFNKGLSPSSSAAVSGSVNSQAGTSRMSGLGASVGGDGMRSVPVSSPQHGAGIVGASSSVGNSSYYYQRSPLSNNLNTANMSMLTGNRVPANNFYPPTNNLRQSTSANLYQQQNRYEKPQHEHLQQQNLIQQYRGVNKSTSNTVLPHTSSSAGSSSAFQQQQQPQAPAVNMDKLNPDILNLLGSTTKATTYSSSRYSNSTASSQLSSANSNSTTSADTNRLLNKLPSESNNISSVMGTRQNNSRDQLNTMTAQASTPSMITTAHHQKEQAAKLQFEQFSAPSSAPSLPFNEQEFGKSIPNISPAAALSTNLLNTSSNSSNGKADFDLSGLKPLDISHSVNNALGQFRNDVNSERTSLFDRSPPDGATSKVE